MLELLLVVKCNYLKKVHKWKALLNDTHIHKHSPLTKSTTGDFEPLYGHNFSFWSYEDIFAQKLLPSVFFIINVLFCEDSSCRDFRKASLKKAFWVQLFFCRCCALWFSLYWRHTAVHMTGHQQARKEENSVSMPLARQHWVTCNGNTFVFSSSLYASPPPMNSMLYLFTF